MINVRVKALGGLRHLNQTCSNCHRGKNIEEGEIIKSAGTNTKRSRRWRGNKEKLKEVCD